MKTDKSKLYTVVCGWIKYIETGEFSGPDKSTILELARTDRDMQKVAISLPVLNESQQKYLVELKDLRDRILMGNVEL